MRVKFLSSENVAAAAAINFDRLGHGSMKDEGHRHQIPALFASQPCSPMFANNIHIISLKLDPGGFPWLVKCPLVLVL